MVQLTLVRFESFVNSERCKTARRCDMLKNQFESFVNSERCKTDCAAHVVDGSLRALLIQKDVKHDETG